MAFLLDFLFLFLHWLNCFTHLRFILASSSLYSFLLHCSPNIYKSPVSVNLLFWYTLSPPPPLFFLRFSSLTFTLPLTSFGFYSFLLLTLLLLYSFLISSFFSFSFIFFPHHHPSSSPPLSFLSHLILLPLLILYLSFFILLPFFSFLSDRFLLSQPSSSPLSLLSQSHPSFPLRVLPMSSHPSSPSPTSFLS